MVITTIEINKRAYSLDLSSPIDISIPFRRNNGVVAFGAKPYEAKPFESGEFIGSLDAGSPVNFYNIKINPHGNGTHTESMLHIDSRGSSIHETLKRFHFLSYLVTVKPNKRENGDLVVERDQMDFDKIKFLKAEALIIRTMPNSETKRSANYTNNNPPYLSSELIKELRNTEVRHLLIDLPSVDREQDGGSLSAHNAFWETDNDPQLDKTITELVYIDNEVKDGLFLLNLQIISLDIDASPSKPILYRIIEDEIN